jgi:NAD(P)-dependent dehydrogenase (short-subunit alcohol dehydrogenase family)
VSESQDRPNQVALITGASRGLGRVVAEFLAAQGYGIIVNARGEKELDALAIHAGKNTAVVAVAGDVTDPKTRKKMLDAARKWNRLDVLVNNASYLGGAPPPSLREVSRDLLLRVLDVNMLAPLAFVQEALPLLVRSHGLVVNISSDAAIAGYPGWGVYGASKAALDLLSKTLAAELKESGVSVVSVDPGDMRTAMHQDAFPGQDISDRPLPDVTLPFWAWLLSQSPTAVNGGRFLAQSPVWEVPR